MWKKWKESKFYKKMRQVRVNRAVYLSAVIILVTLAVILAVSAALNRAKKNETEEPPAITDATPDQNTPTPDDSLQTGTEDKVPTLALPTAGKLLKEHSTDVQVFSQTMKDYRVHLGVDIACEASAPVCAAADGTVAQIWEDPMMGWCVAITHAGDCVTVYKNLAKDMAEGLAVGSAVLQGQLIGQVGDSALVEIAEDPHLHMEMTVKGLQVDPMEYFSQSVVNTLTEDEIYEDGK
ncbi:MAG: M23 family metallopeptidase [Clostridia bacterium]|nr:M23 family metallopeptidase [Clostridia bacterium]